VPQKTQKAITEKQWKRAADAYEVGTKSGRQIASEFGVSPSTVSRELKRRGCVEWSKAPKFNAALEAELDRQARARAPMEDARHTAALARVAATDRLITDMMRAIIAAEKLGNLSLAAGMIKETGKSLGVTGLR
jgi:DNA-binding MurR/RpiR family transcriptional regulator